MGPTAELAQRSPSPCRYARAPSGNQTGGDESVIAVDRQALVMELGHEISDVATTRSEARETAVRTAPGLILGGGSSSIDALKDFFAKTTAPVIFISARPERHLTRERPEPAFLSTKPFEPATAKAAIDRSLCFHPRQGPPA
jgi:hypothetical protein